MSHTQGPWRYRSIPEPTGRPIAYWIDWADSNVPLADIYDRPDAEANARLIAAAPELLKCASRILDLIESGDWPLPEGYCETDVNWLRTVVHEAQGVTP